MDQQTQHSDDQGSISEDDFVRLDDELPATVEMNVLEQEKQQQDQTQQLILRQLKLRELEYLQQSQQITPAFKPEQSPFQQTEMASIPQLQKQRPPQQELLQQLQQQQQQQQLQQQQQQLLLQHRRQQMLQFQQRSKQHVYQLPQQPQHPTGMLCECHNISLKETISGDGTTTVGQENAHLKMSILETKNQLLEEKLKNRELMDQIHVLTEENKALKRLKESDEKAKNGFEEIQRKMDEFKEEYAKKLSLQNDQLEELKKAFLGFQQKVDNSKKKLNGMEAIEGHQVQQKMPMEESMPTQSSLPNSNKSDHQSESDLADISEKLRQLECIYRATQSELEKQNKQNSCSMQMQIPPPMFMSMEAKIAAINKHLSIDVGNIDYSAIDQLLEVHFSWSGPFRKLANTFTGHPIEQVEQSGLGQTVEPNGPGHGPRPPAQSRQIMAAEKPAEQDPVPEEKIIFMQKQLALMLHAHKCQQEDRVSLEGGKQPCYAVHCSCMKGSLEHIVSCKYGKQCQYPQCTISQQIIVHWKNCCKYDCTICTPLKKKYNNNNNTNHGADVASVNDECTSNPATQINEQQPRPAAEKNRIE